MTRNAADRINAALADEAQHIARTAIIDLDAFLALTAEQRAARWRQLDGGSKFQLVALMIERRGCEWSDELVAMWIAKYDERWGAKPMPREAAVAAALERLAEENAAHARTARQASEAEDARYFQRACTAFTNALIEWRRGVRPERLHSGAWLLPSRRAGEAPHIVRLDGDWICNCRAQAAMHWPIAMVVGMEIADEDLARFDDPAEDPPPVTWGSRAPAVDIITVERRQLAEPPPAPPVDDGPQDNWGGHRMPLGQRLAQARRAFAEAA